MQIAFVVICNFIVWDCIECESNGMEFECILTVRMAATSWRHGTDMVDTLSLANRCVDEFEVAVVTAQQGGVSQVAAGRRGSVSVRLLRVGVVFVDRELVY